MDDIIVRIKSYVLVINPDLDDDDFLDFVVNSVVDRALVYMNRDQLVDQYEADLIDPSVDEEDYVLPIPKHLERPLASTVVGVYRTVQSGNSTETGRVTRVKDQVQEVQFSDKVASYVSTASDEEIFSGVKSLMDRYLIARIIKNENTSYLYYNNLGRVL